jgi:tetratricopeptide (TPR) repeat protein
VLMMFVVGAGILPGLTLPSTPEGQFVLAFTWAPAILVGLLLLIALLVLFIRRIPSGDSDEGRAPAWFRLLVAGFCVALLQVVVAGVVVLVQADAFTQPDLAQEPPRVIVAVGALLGLFVLLIDYSRNSARALARGRARLAGPFDTPVIGLLTPTEERVSSAYGRVLLYTTAGRRLTGLSVLIVFLPVLALAGLYVLGRQGYALERWPLLVPFLLCWGAYLLVLLRVNAARRRLNRRSLMAYCQELAALGRKWLAAVDGEMRQAGLGMYQRVADLADALGKEKLLQQNSVEVAEAVAEARLALAQASLEPGGEGVKAAAEYLAGAVELRDLKQGEWLGLGWLLASDYVPESLVRDRARYGHLLLNYCRAWVAAQRQLREKAPLSAGIKTNVRLRLVVGALEHRVCSLEPASAAEQPEQGGPKDVPWRRDTFLLELAARPDVQLLLALNEAMLQLDETLLWARLNAGLCRLAVGDGPTARAHLEVAASQRRDDWSLAFYRAVAYAREQQSSEALALLEEVTERDLGWFPAVRLYAETLVEVSKTPIGAVTTILSDQAVTAERWKRALTLIERALGQPEVQTRLQLPGAAPIYVAAGMAELFGRQRPAEADVWFRRALGVDRQQAPAWYGLAMASWEQGALEVALSAAQETMRYQPQHVPAAALSAHLLMVRGEMAPALAMSEQALQLLADPRVAPVRVAHHPRLFPEREVLLRVKGRAAFEQGRFAEAFAALDQVVRRYVDARFFAACALYHLGRYREATERLKDYLASKEGARDHRAFLYLGCALHAQGKDQQRAALNALESCLELAKPGAPERLRALLERGQLYEEREQFEEAQRDYEAALEIEQTPVTVYVLAALYHRAGRDQQAYDLLRPLIEADGGAPVGRQQSGAPGAALSAQAAGKRPAGGSTLVLLQANEPIEAQSRRLFGIVRDRLAGGVPENTPPTMVPAQPAAPPADQRSKPSISVTAVPSGGQAVPGESAGGQRSLPGMLTSSADGIPVDEGETAAPAEDGADQTVIPPEEP